MQCLGIWVRACLCVRRRALGVSLDTLRRWDRAGRLQTTRDERNRRLVPATEIERLSTHPKRHRAGHTLSARNRFAGVIRSVEVVGVMALVEIEAGPFLVTAAVTRDAVEERLEPATSGVTGRRLVRRVASVSWSLTGTR
jgi:molybdopterin-binding protein